MTRFFICCVVWLLSSFRGGGGGGGFPFFLRGEEDESWRGGRSCGSSVALHLSAERSQALALRHPGCSQWGTGDAASSKPDSKVAKARRTACVPCLSRKAAPNSILMAAGVSTWLTVSMRSTCTMCHHSIHHPMRSPFSAWKVVCLSHPLAKLFLSLVNRDTLLASASDKDPQKHHMVPTCECAPRFKRMILMMFKKGAESGAACPYARSLMKDVESISCPCACRGRLTRAVQTPLACNVKSPAPGFAMQQMT